MTPLQRFVQYVIIFSALINMGNFWIACDRYSRELQKSQPFYTDVRSGNFDKIREINRSVRAKHWDEDLGHVPETFYPMLRPYANILPINRELNVAEILVGVAFGNHPWLLPFNHQLNPLPTFAGFADVGVVEILIPFESGGGVRQFRQSTHLVNQDFSAIATDVSSKRYDNSTPFSGISLPFDDHTTLFFAQIRTQRLEMGRVMGSDVLQIAAIALAHDLILMTHKNEFSFIDSDGLEGDRSVAFFRQHDRSVDLVGGALWDLPRRDFHHSDLADWIYLFSVCPVADQDADFAPAAVVFELIRDPA